MKNSDEVVVMSEKVYVFKFWTGQYSDYSENNVKAFLTRAKANAYVKKIKKKIIAFGCQIEKSGFKLNSNTKSKELVDFLKKEFEFGVYIDQVFGFDLTDIPLVK